ncbi:MULTISPECIES: peptide-methionine (R)-S-oxide reductase MsrB [Tenacibaculum]|uniref:peptide-methionine (R)-S-oxide reductase MsrB n=1 Tax=Tenacibaculum TaxID=104267 RepID=UPI001F0AF4E4|nr:MULTISPECIES: peptide-methionine (R)-S-oxide reductase MsrB [Tenacibaculum]MCH3882900.1 peptide-methionine (R)-S-oxide reductase MsrB [Tenacibaculum aquimarinum]MDO6600839.1 peptide-methionine (R)-S-oxide reductase MsrB [Tenacibaculum sp. 1_MG-2023]
MRNSILLITLSLFLNCTLNGQNKSDKKTQYKITKTDAEWKNSLTKMQYYVLREAGTERAFSSSLDKNYTDGTYNCAACNTPLYKSQNKFDSGSGWPSFDRAVKGNVALDVDYKLGYARTELKCNTCGGHLGHSFNDGPQKTTGKRHCINGVALNFIPK